MTVKQLIEELEKVEDKNKVVMISAFQGMQRDLYTLEAVDTKHQLGPSNWFEGIALRTY